MAQYGIDPTQRWRNPGLRQGQQQPYVGGLGQGRGPGVVSPGGGGGIGPPVWQPGQGQGGQFESQQGQGGPVAFPGGNPGGPLIGGGPVAFPGGNQGGPQTWFGPQQQPKGFDPSAHPMIQLAALALLHHAVGAK